PARYRGRPAFEGPVSGALCGWRSLEGSPRDALVRLRALYCPTPRWRRGGLSMPAISFSGCRRARLLGYNEGLTDLSKAPGLRSKCRKAANRMQLCGHPWQWRRDHFRQKALDSPDGPIGPDPATATFSFAAATAFGQRTSAGGWN